MNDITKTDDKENAFGALEMDPARYREYLEQFDLTEDQERELLKTLWSIMTTFVELGFGLDAVQMNLAVVGQDSYQGRENAIEQKTTSLMSKENALSSDAGKES